MDGPVATLWLIFATFLVLSMQAGFLMLEGGRVRSKNSINVAQKNITDLIVIWIVFFAVGFTVMFGFSINEVVNGVTAESGLTPLHFIYQAAFCSTTATILSGAVAERMSFKAYLCLVAVIGVCIYPLVGRMVWGNTYDTSMVAWLGDMGFMDFAGSTVVHGVGAWVGLIAILMIGPRTGRFDQQGKPVVMAAHNAVIALFGLFVLVLGWLGFNGGAVSPGDPLLPKILFNTITSGMFGGATGMAVGVWLDKGIFNPSRVTSGLLGGLVACTAGINYFDVYDSVMIGAAGGAIATGGAHYLLHKCKLDDPLDVVATHGLAGVLGTLAVAWVAPVSMLVGNSRLQQLMTQAAGVLIVLMFTCLLTWLALTIIKQLTPLRVSTEAEALGLNYTEHGESIGLDRLQKTLNEKLQSNDSFADGLTVDSDDEHSELAATLNSVINRYEEANNEIVNGQRRFQQFAETASDWLWESDAAFRLSFIHSNSPHIQNLALNGLVGCHLLDVLELTSDDLSLIKDCIQTGVQTPVFEASLILDKADSTPVQVEVRAVPNRDEHGLLNGYRGTITDISVRKSAENKALYLSLHDELTELPNRRALQRDLDKAMKKAQRSQHSVVIAGIDLDGFKAINDTHGHMVGDLLLQQVADRLRGFLRPLDVAYRTGGDEFIVVFDSLTTTIAVDIGYSVSDKLISELSKPYSVKTLTLTIGASIGLSAYPNHSNDISDVLRMADLALYAAKEAGKGCVVKFEQAFDKDAKLQRQLEQDIHKAITNNEFYLMYQPQVDTLSESVIGYEALLRWAHPERGEIPPGDFIDLAEKLKLMDSIGEFVLREACKFASTWAVDANTATPKISINVSPQQLRNKQFVSLVTETLNENQMDPRQLELEITEGMLVHDFQMVTATLQELKQLGISVAVDDFGTGQTSLRYISQFPLTTIKIDRSFVKNLGTSQKAAEITRTIVMLGQKLGINVIAEGVEEDNQLNMLRQWNCDQIQGFLFSKPVSEATVKTMLASDEPLRDTLPIDFKKSA